MDSEDQVGRQRAFATKEEVAEFLGMSKRAVDSLLAEGMPCLRVNARVLRFDLEEVRAWFKDRYSSNRRTGA